MAMKIKSIETFTSRSICFVRVTDDTGDCGWGMTAPFEADITAQVLHRICANIALEPFEDFTAVADEIIYRQYKFLGSFLARAAAGVDTALWDLFAKKKGVSVAEFAGSKENRSHIDLYASSMKRDLPVQEEADRLRALQEKYGYRAIKLHPGIPVGRDKDFWENRTEDMIVAMAKTARPGTHLIVDVNGNYSVEKAIEVAHLMREYDYKLFEEPCPYWEIEKTKAVREACAKIGLPVAGGEQDYIDIMWERMIDQRVMDVCQPDILYVGGFTRALRVARHAAKNGLQVTPHTSNRSPIFVMGLHYMACIDTPYPFLEVGIEDDAWAVDCYGPQVVISGGQAAVPTVPGWGFEPDKEFLAKAKYEISR